MNKVLIGAAAVVVIAGGIGAATLLSSNDKETSDYQKPISERSETQGPATNNPITEQASIEDLLTRNASLKCTFDVSEEGSVNKGTAYFAGGKNMYGEFTTTTNNETTSAFIIRNGDTQYVWTTDSDMGFKQDVSASDKETQQQMSQQLDPEQKYEFKCENWAKDESLFTPPASITFTDIGEQTRQIQEAMEAAEQQ